MKFLKLNIQLFGASASNSKTLTASSGNKGTLSVSLAENSTNSSTNKSNITVTATFKMTSGGYSGYSTPRVEIWWYDNNGYTTITRKAYTNAGTLARNNSVKATATFDVEHKADGTLSGYARANWVWDGGGTYCPPSGNVSTSSTALTTILRGITEISNITDSTNYINGTFTVTANPQASGKYYKIEWYIYNQNNSKYTICTDNLGTFATGSRTIQTKTFTSAQLTNIYANSTNTAKPKLYAVVHTYDDSGYATEIMSTEAKTIDVYLPESIKPTGSTTITDTVTKPSGLTDYVRGISKPSFAISITNNNGATISSCTIKLNGSQIKSWDTASTSYTYAHTDVLPNVTNPYEIEATDTRGRKYTASGNITALDYSAPIVDITSAERNSTTNTTIDLKINGTITALNNKNAKSFIIEKKLNTATTWDSVTTLTNYTYTDYAYSIPNCSADNIYNIRIRAVDSFGNSSDNATVGTSFSLIDFKQGGKGLAFGKAATTDNLFECDLDAQFNKTINQVGNLSNLNTSVKTNIVSAINVLAPGEIVGSKLDAAGGYIKYSNGFIIQWKFNGGTGGGNAWTSPIHYSDISMGNWDVAFTTIFNCIPTVASSLYWCTCSEYGNTSAGTVRVFRPNYGTTTVWVRVFAYGTWK
ncbi:MAG: hypothetical protein II393_04080 [Cytophagales bacterium]|nr:hypothetical protein [Cytophagales bacterium]